MEDQSIYVEIESSNFVRRNILESTADSLKLLKDIEENRNKFQEEENIFKKFKNQLIRIRTSASKFGELLPKISEGAPQEEEVKKGVIVKKKAEPKTEVDILKDEIDSIERKLKEL